MAEKKLAFLFGAGAEIDFELPSGFDYLKESILLRDDSSDEISESKMKSDLLTVFNKDYFDKEKYKTPRCFRYKNNKRCSFNDSEMYHRLIAEYIFDKHPVIDYPDAIQSLFTGGANLTETKKNEKIVKIKKELSRNKSFFQACEKKFEDDLKSDKSFEVNRYIAGILDSYFHTIINPVKFGEQRFSKIFNYYWACYFSIVNGILKYLKAKDPQYEEYYENGKLSYKKILEKISDFTGSLYKNPFEDNESYYRYIKEHLQENQNYSLSGVITTNYFNFAERELKKTGVNFAYPNGQLKLFEFPESLEVKDITKDCKTDGSFLFFPFIFGQSYVKPIIHPIQIKEFSTINAILSDSDWLVVLGYGINEDDNHLNAYLHDFANEHKILIVTDEEEKIALPKYKARLRIGNENLHICNVNYNSEKRSVIEKIFEKLVSI